MDGSRFDRLAREVVSTGSRRALVRWAVAGLASGALVSHRATVEAVGCPAGQHNPTHSLCEPCPVGTYSDHHDSETCTPCATGFSQPNTGQTSCLACAPGTVQPNTGQAACLPCPAGKIAANAGSAACTPCQPGSFSANAGGDICTACPAGTAQPNSGSTTCPVCPDSTTSPGSTVCKGEIICPANVPKLCPGQNGQASICCKRQRKCSYGADGTPRCKKKRTRR
jgi:hypothetical protein